MWHGDALLAQVALQRALGLRRHRGEPAHAVDEAAHVGLLLQIDAALGAERERGQGLGDLALLLVDLGFEGRPGGMLVERGQVALGEREPAALVVGEPTSSHWRCLRAYSSFA